MDEDYIAMRLLTCDVDGCLELAAWIERQSPEWRAETCLAMTGHELYPKDEPGR